MQSQEYECCSKEEGGEAWQRQGQARPPSSFGLNWFEIAWKLLTLTVTGNDR